MIRAFVTFALASTALIAAASDFEAQGVGPDGAAKYDTAHHAVAQIGHFTIMRASDPFRKWPDCEAVYGDARTAVRLVYRDVFLLNYPALTKIDRVRIRIDDDERIDLASGAEFEEGTILLDHYYDRLNRAKRLRVLVEFPPSVSTATSSPNLNAGWDFDLNGLAKVRAYLGSGACKKLT